MSGVIDAGRRGVMVRARPPVSGPMPTVRAPRQSPSRPLSRQIARRVWPYVAALAIVGVSTLAAEAVYKSTHSGHLSLIFLMGVLVAAVFLGAGPGYLAAAAAFLIYNFDLVDPRFTISIGSPEDFITLVVFLTVAIMTGNLTERIRAEARRAKARAATTAVLFEATRAFSASSDEAQIRQRLAHHLSVAAKGEAFVRDGLGMFAEPPDAEIGRDLILEAAAVTRDADVGLAATAHHAAWALRPLVSGEAVLGLAAWRTLAPSDLSTEEQALVELLADAGATAISRAKLAAAKSEAETRARTEDLRNALLSSISHDMRTPLAAIMVSAGSLRRYGAGFDDATRADLSATIEEEAGRLDAFVANLLSMTRLESGELAAQRIGFSVPEVIERIVARRNTSRRSVRVCAAQGLPEGAGDPLLFEQVFGNVLENALRYSGDNDPVTVSTELLDQRIVVEVTDEGQGVAPDDLGRIFEKFFRSPGVANKPGTGLGLAIARGLVEAMGGTIEARNRPDGRPGLRVDIALPVMA